MWRAWLFRVGRHCWFLLGFLDVSELCPHHWVSPPQTLQTPRHPCPLQYAPGFVLAQTWIFWRCCTRPPPRNSPWGHADSYISLTGRRSYDTEFGSVWKMHWEISVVDSDLCWKVWLCLWLVLVSRWTLSLEEKRKIKKICIESSLSVDMSFWSL